MPRLGGRHYGRRCGMPPGALLQEPELGPGRITLCGYGAEGTVFLKRFGTDDFSPTHPSERYDGKPMEDR